MDCDFYDWPYPKEDTVETKLIECALSHAGRMKELNQNIIALRDRADYRERQILALQNIEMQSANFKSVTNQIFNQMHAVKNLVSETILKYKPKR